MFLLVQNLESKPLLAKQFEILKKIYKLILFFIRQHYVSKDTNQTKEETIVSFFVTFELLVGYNGTLFTNQSLNFLNCNGSSN